MLIKCMENDDDDIIIVNRTDQLLSNKGLTFMEHFY